MRRAVVALALALAALAGPVASAATDGTPIPVTIEFGDYAPAQLDVVVGETVKWTNDSVRQHTVTADDDSFGSEHISLSGTYSHTFATAGAVPYHCTIHPSIRGEVDVRNLLLNRVTQAAAPNRAFPLTGRSALADGTAVSIEGDDGSGFKPVGAATIGPDGNFATNVTPGSTTVYRAVAGAEISPPIQVLVLDRKLTVSVTRAKRGTVITATVSPASPGATVVLQLHLRERFGWWPIQVARLDRASRARWIVRRGHAAPARVVLTLADRATPLAISRTVHVRPAAPK